LWVRGALWKISLVPLLRLGQCLELFELGSRESLDVRLGFVPADGHLSATFSKLSTLHVDLRSRSRAMTSLKHEATEDTYQVVNTPISRPLQTA
jgi:hypothetical protein